MEAAQTSAPQETYPPFQAETVSRAPASVDAGLRRCLVTGAMLPKEELFRFVVGPEASLYPDLAQNLPGRGLWVSIDREALAQAIKKNLFTKAAKKAVKIAPDLIDQIVVLLHKRCLDFIGLAKRSGLAVPGQTQVEAELKGGKLEMLLIASDAGGDMNAFRAARNLDVSSVFSRQELGNALGYEAIAYAGFKPHALTGKLKGEIRRLEKLTGTHHITQGKE